MRPAPAGPWLVLSPHLDDAVLSAWSVLTACAEVCVANICTAAPAAGTLGEWDRVVGASDSVAMMRSRRSEDRTALALAGRTPINLAFLDAQYRSEPLDRSRVLDALGDLLACAGAIYAPAGLGRHPDHVAVREVALKAGAQADRPVYLYGELPYAVQLGWPPAVTGEPQRPRLRPEVRWETDLATAACGLAGLTLRARRLSDDESERKLAAMEAYRTQFDALNGGSLDLLRRPDVLRFEVLWEVGRP